MTDMIFDKSCRACPRLAAFLDNVNERYPDYYCKPGPPFGAPSGPPGPIGPD